MVPGPKTQMDADGTEARVDKEVGGKDAILDTSHEVAC